jgi:hypothetical protein
MPMTWAFAGVRVVPDNSRPNKPGSAIRLSLPITPLRGPTRSSQGRVASALCQTAASRTSSVGSIRRKPLFFYANTQTKAFVAPGRDLITFLLICGDPADIRHEYTGFPRDIGADVP